MYSIQKDMSKYSIQIENYGLHFVIDIEQKIQYVIEKKFLQMCCTHDIIISVEKGYTKCKY